MKTEKEIQDKLKQLNTNIDTLVDVINNDGGNMYYSKRFHELSEKIKLLEWVLNKPPK